MAHWEEMRLKIASHKYYFRENLVKFYCELWPFHLRNNYNKKVIKENENKNDLFFKENVSISDLGFEKKKERKKSLTRDEFSLYKALW